VPNKVRLYGWNLKIPTLEIWSALHCARLMLFSNCSL